MIFLEAGSRRLSFKVLRPSVVFPAAIVQANQRWKQVGGDFLAHQSMLTVVTLEATGHRLSKLSFLTVVILDKAETLTCLSVCR